MFTYKSRKKRESVIFTTEREDDENGNEPRKILSRRHRNKLGEGVFHRWLRATDSRQYTGERKTESFRKTALLTEESESTTEMRSFRTVRAGYDVTRSQLNCKPVVKSSRRTRGKHPRHREDEEWHFRSRLRGAEKLLERKDGD